jgi:predicted Zn-dependent protease
VTGYSPDFLRAALKRFRSVADFEDYARSHPVYGEEIRKLDAEETRMLFLPYDDAQQGSRRRDELAELRRNLVIAAVTKDEKPTSVHEPKRKPRHRPLIGLPVDAVRELEALLARRKRTGKPSQEDIAAEVERMAQKVVPKIRFDRNRVQQAEGLQAVGWPLLRSHPDFSAESEFVYWPTVQKAREILDSERSA